MVIARRIFQVEAFACATCPERFDERRRVGDDDDLARVRWRGDETRERRQQVGVKAGLGFVRT